MSGIDKGELDCVSGGIAALTPMPCLCSLPCHRTVFPRRHMKASLCSLNLESLITLGTPLPGKIKSVFLVYGFSFPSLAGILTPQ